MNNAKAYEKISEMLGADFKLHEKTISDISYRCSPEAFRHFLDKSSHLNLTERPRLLACFADRLRGTQEIVIVLEFQVDSPKVIIFSEFPGNEELPLISKIWKHAIVWELEAGATNGVRWSRECDGGVSWHST